MAGAADRLLTINELAARLAVSLVTIYRLVNSGVLPYVRVGDRLRFRVSEIDAYIERDRRKP